MPVQGNILANMDQMNLPSIINTAEQTKFLRVRNELLGYEAEEAQQIAKRNAKRREIQEMYASMPARIDKYIEMGMHKEADEAKEALLAGHRQEVAMYEIMAAKLDALDAEEKPGAWLQMRDQALKAGMVDRDGMPDNYEDGGQNWIDTWLKKTKGDLKKLEFTYGEPPSEEYPEGRTMTEDILQQDGEIQRQGPAYEDTSSKQERTGTGAYASTWQMKASDTGQIKAEAAMILGGHFDPETKQFQGIAGKELKVAELIRRASKYYNDARGRMPHGEAVALAAEDMNKHVGGGPDTDNILNLDLPPKT